MSAAPQVRPATHDDLPAIARVHVAAFRGFFLTELGEPFLREYYRMVLCHEGGIVLVTPANGPLAGFVAGFMHPDAFYRTLSASKWRLGLRVLRTAIRRPSVLPRALANARRARQGGVVQPPHPGIACELSSIGVRPDHHGHGTGRALVTEFLQRTRHLGADYVYLTTDAENNDPVNAFYLKLGFALVERLATHQARPMNLYSLCLNDAQGDPSCPGSA